MSAAASALPADDRLPAIAALRARGARAVLAAAGVAGPDGPVRVLKHHPGTRCTLLVGADRRRVVLKATAGDPTGDARALAHLARHGLAGGRPPTAPPVLGYDARLRTLVIGFLDGPTALALVASGRGARAGELAAEWLRAAAAVPVGGLPVRTAQDTIADGERWVATVAGADAALGGAAARIAERLAAEAPPSRSPVLQHGSLSANHVLDLGSGPGVIDVDRLGAGAAERDAARFLGTLARAAGALPALAGEAARAEAALLAGAGDLLSPAALAWYRAAAAVKDAKYLAKARPPRWRERASALLDAAAAPSALG